MAKQKFANILIWLIGIIVSLAIAFGMTSKVLVIPFIPEIVTVVVGWIVVGSVVIAALLKLIE